MFKFLRRNVKANYECLSMMLLAPFTHCDRRTSILSIYLSYWVAIFLRRSWDSLHIRSANRDVWVVWRVVMLFLSTQLPRNYRMVEVSKQVHYGVLSMKICIS